MRYRTVSRTAVFFVMALVGPWPVGHAVAQEKKCLYQGRRLTAEQVVALYAEGKRSFCRTNLEKAALGRANLAYADLSHADLRGADLRGAHLNSADLRGARLDSANLTGAYLSGGAHLEGAHLHGVRLSGAHLNSAHLDGAYLYGAHLDSANLTGAHLTGAHLTGAHLDGANLTAATLTTANLGYATLRDADLRNANLTGAYLFEATLGGSIFEPQADSVTQINDIEFAEGLSELTFLSSPTPLFLLREGFKRKGLRRQEREITYAILRTERMADLWGKGKELSTRIEAAVRYLFFELTCGYGLFYGRPLRILGVSIVLFAVPYLLALVTRKGRGGLWAIWVPDRVLKDEGQADPVRLSASAPWRWPGGSARNRVQHYLRIGWFAAYFSLLSSFHFGFREFNVGTWLARVQPREYTLRATGWVRVVSGLQSLLSFYMIVLAVLSYFGRPFE